MNIFNIIISSVLLLSPSPSLETKGWHGIVPLRSTRADVEALLGPGTPPGKGSYYRDDVNIFFVYTSGNCQNGGWNVAPNTVIRITIYPKTKPQLADLQLNESKFVKKPELGDGVLYANDEEGFSIEVWQDT